MRRIAHRRNLRETTNPIPNLATGPASTAVVINTTMRVTHHHSAFAQGNVLRQLAAAYGIGVLTLNIGGAPRRRRMVIGLVLGCFFSLSLLLSGCGSKSTTNTTGTPAGTYIVTISAASNQATRSTTVTLVVQ